ncbi:MAG TPA: DUF2207 domain-containing protein [Gemmatimonadales bacterium]|nr:DUF2207 domain-containing protein [Gemmatimonadales bacterium]
MPKPSAFLALLALLATAAPVVAQERSYTIDRVHVRVEVLTNGQIDVTESITATFNGSYNGIYRRIPLQYRNSAGLNWSIALADVRATDGEGNPLRIEQLREGFSAKIKMYIPGANDATRTVVLHYRASNALRFFEDHDELYWNATGDEWDVALGEVSAEVILPEGVRGVRATSFNGVYGAKGSEAVIDSTLPRHLTFTMPRKLEYREGLTVVVGWNKGLVRAPSAADKAGRMLRDNWPLFIPIPVFFLMFWLWRTRGRDPEARPVMATYEPPGGMTPAEAGTLTDESVDMRDITATMVDLAVRGFIKIEERQNAKFLGLFGGGTDYWFHSTKGRPTWEALLPHEQRLLQGIFRSSATSVQMSDLTNEFYTEIGGIKSAVFDQLVEKGYYRTRPDRVRGGWVAAGFILGFVIAIPGSAIATKFFLTPVPFVIAGVLSGLIIVAFGWNMPARTEAGARAFEAVQGFEDFLTRVDSDRFERVIKTPEMFERFLPYAMAFGVDKQWTRAFADIYTQPPTWYVGGVPGQFNIGHFSSSLNTMTHQASSAMSSQPRSSGGSGFSGGGSSGGGGGGGGGGAF